MSRAAITHSTGIRRNLTGRIPPRAGRGEESGYALLLVLAMAAAVAMEFYLAVPRISFESRRAKEQVLIERGEQYKRAIQVFVRRNRRYPMAMEELEDLQNRRSLRKRYADPMTGSDTWRLVHIAPGGILTDSVINLAGQQNPLGLANLQPAGLSASQPAGLSGSQPNGGGMALGAGIAGVASLAELSSIKLYNDRQKYNEWEFIYDISKDLAMMGSGFGLGARSGPKVRERRLGFKPTLGVVGRISAKGSTLS